MKLGVVGSKTFTDYELFKKEILSNISLSGVDLVISDDIKNIANLSEQFTNEFNIKLRIAHPEYGSYGQDLGFKRDEEMILSSDFLIIFRDTRFDAGTVNIAILAKWYKIPYKIVHVN